MCKKMRTFVPQMSKYSLLLLSALLLVASCRQKKPEPVTTPWGTVLQDSVEVSEDFDLKQIQGAGELIMATVLRPVTTIVAASSVSSICSVCDWPRAWASACVSTSVATLQR